MTGLAGGSNTHQVTLEDFPMIDVTTPAPTQPLSLVSELGRLHELPPTKSMKVLVKNLVAKIDRLQKRVLRYTPLVTVGDADGWLYSPLSAAHHSVDHEQAKKLYQFRLVGIDTIRKDNLEKLNRIVSMSVAEILLKDVNDDLNACKEKLTNAPTVLRAELTEHKNRQLGSSLLSSDEEKLKMEEYWDNLIKYNGRLLEMHLLKLKGGSIVSCWNDDPNFEQLLNELNNNLFNHILITDGSSDEASKGRHPRPAELQKKKRPSRRGAKRQAKRSQNKKTQAEQAWEQKGKGPQIEETEDEFETFVNECRQTARKAKNKKVFVNVHLENTVAIPSYVFNSLNLGANYQLCSMPSQSSLRSDWQKAKAQIGQKVGGAKKLPSAVINYIDSINDQWFCNNNFINKVSRNVGLRRACNANFTLRRVYEFLVNNDLIVILADKNLGLTIVNKDWYHVQMQIHFDNTSLFRPISASALPGGSFNSLIKQKFFKLKTVVRACCSDPTQVDRLVSHFYDESFVVLPQTYGLIKLHKKPAVLRYITPVTNWINVPVARYVAKFLQPYVEKLYWILPSSTTLINLAQSECFGDSIFIGSWDVQDMYNQIDQSETIGAIRSLASRNKWNVGNTSAQWNFVLNLLSWVFDSSYVSYKDQVFEQIRGLPMGSPLSPVVANLYMASLEQDITFGDFLTRRFIYRRYLDDVFVFYNTDYSGADLEVVHPGLKVATEYLRTISLRATSSNINFLLTKSASKIGERIEYLDLDIMIVKRNMHKALAFSVFDKPSNLHIYTDPTTFYPFHYVYGWIQGENIRLIRNSSSDNAYKHSLDLFKQFLFRRSYLADTIERYISYNLYEDREDLLHGRKPHLARLGKTNMNDSTNKNKFILIENSGSRVAVVNAVKNINRSLVLASSPTRLIPVVKRGKSVLSVVSKTRQ
ncbi:unnamed protein product [Rhizophagus irregularis]|nr:unnamed protein product [Rhizophagus irregularis]